MISRYETEAMRHIWGEAAQMERIGGVKYVMKDGILYDAKQLLADVEKMVSEAKTTK